MTLKLRASALPLAFLCPGSVRSSEVEVDETGEPARLGRAVHELLAALAETGAIPWDRVGETSLRNNVDANELEFLCRRGVLLWREAGHLFPSPLTEELVDMGVVGDFQISGHLDLVSIHGDVARGGDWKTGYLDSDYSEQMKAYAALLLLRYPELREATLTALWVRDCTVENYTMGRSGAEAWLARLREQVVEWDGRYHAGEHCGHCRRSHECPAANAIVRRDVAAILDVDTSAVSISAMTPEQLIGLAKKASLVVKYAERARKAIKQQLIAAGDIVGATSMLTIVDEPRHRLVPEKAWPVLERIGFGDDEMGQVMTLHKSKCEDVAKKLAGKGNGAAAVRDLNTALREADALETATIQRMVEKRL